MNQKIPEGKGYCFNPGCQNPQEQADRGVCSSCGARLLLSDRYRAIRLLGRGGMSQTFLTADQAYNPPMLCVVKQLWGEATRRHPFQQYQSFAQQKERDYPHLPHCLDQLEQDGMDYLVQEYIPGESLASVLSTRGTFSVKDIWQLLAQLLPTIQQLHQQGIIHGDIKPENIICRIPREPSSPQGILDHLVLVDVGLTQYLPPASVQSTLAIGSSAYAAPEQLQGKPLQASDLYSLGVTCIHLLTGIHPFGFLDSSDRQWLWQNDMPTDTQSGSNLPLVQFLEHLIAQDLKQRIGATEVAITEMQKLRGQRIVPIPLPPRSPPWTCYATLVGHSGLFANINAVAIAPNSLLVASASDDKTIRLWEMQTGQQRFVLHGHTHFVKSVAFHPSNPNLLVSSGRDRQIYLWDLQAKEITQTLTGHEQAVNTVLFSPDGHLLVSGSADKTIKLWNTQSGACLASLRGHTLGVTALAFGSLLSNAGNRSILASTSADSTVQIWDLVTQQLIATLTGHTAAVRAIAFSPDRTWLATGGDDRTIRIWDVSSQRCLRILTGHPWEVSALITINNGKFLLSGSWDKTLKVWDIPSGRNTATLSGHSDSVSCLAIAPDQQRMVSGSYDKTLKLWQWDNK